MVFTLIEIAYIIITVLIISYIFTGIIKLPQKSDLESLLKRKRFDWKDQLY